MVDLPSPSFTLSGLAGDVTAGLTDLRLGFRQGFVFELMDVRRAAPIEVHVMVINPRRYTISEPFQSELTPGDDDNVVAEENGIIVREITLEGTFGLKPKTATGFLGVQGGGAAISGNEHFQFLRKMFRRYSALKKTEDSAFIKLIFHCLKDDDHFIVVPRQFETPRDARTTRVHYDYMITLAAIAVADSTTLTPVPVDGGLDAFTNVLATVSEAFNDARAYFAEVTAVLSQVKRKVQNIQAVMLNVAAFVNSVGNALKAGADLIKYPFQMAVNVLDTIDDAADTLVTSLIEVTETDEFIEHALRRMRASLDRIVQFPQLFDMGASSAINTVTRAYEGEKRVTSSDIAAGIVDIGTRTRLALGSSGQSGLDLGDYRGIRRELILRTSSIDSFAAQFSVPPELIVLINDLRSPYIAEGGGPGVLGPGDEIMIPVKESIEETDATQSPRDYLSAEEALYGIDLALDPDILAKEGRFEIMEDPRDYDDAQTIRGIANVAQGTEITVRTERGSTTFLPDIGIRRSVGVKGTLQHTILTSLTLREAILQDPRIESIQKYEVTLDRDVLSQIITPQLVGSKSGVRLVLPFGKVSG